MSDVFDVLLKKLKQRTFTLRELEIKIENARFAVQKGSETYENDKRYFREFMSSEWVRLEDVKSAIQQLKQKYVLIKREKLEDFRCFIRKKAEECLREMETEEGIIREGLEARLGVYDEITLKLEELLRENE